MKFLGPGNAAIIVLLILPSGMKVKQKGCIPVWESCGKGIDAGRDTGTQVGDYPADFPFEGAIEDLRVLIKE